MDLSVVIPVKNEAGNIAPLVGEIAAALDGVADYEIVYVDDGSTDATAAEIRGAAADDAASPPVPPRGELRAERGGPHRGRGGARAPGSRRSTATGRTIRPISRRCGASPARRRATPPLLIAGHRARRRDTWSKRMSSRIANGIRRRMLHDDTPDTGCGLKLFPRALFLDLPYFDHMHRFLPALVLRAGGAVRSVPVNHRPRERGTSKYGVLDRLAVGITDLFGVMWLRRRGSRAGRGRGRASSRARPLPMPDDHKRRRCPRASRRPCASPGCRSRRVRRVLVAGDRRGVALAGGVRSRARWARASPGRRSRRSSSSPLHVAASLLFVPRTLLAIVAGLVVRDVVGHAVGGARQRRRRDAPGFLSRATSMPGSSTRRAGRGSSGPLGRVERGGWRAVAMIRLIPVIPHSLTNYALGLTRLRPRALRVRLAAGPVAADDRLCRSRRGRRARSCSAAGGWVVPTVIGAAALALSLLIPLIARRRPAPRGIGPPVAQSSSSTVCTTGTARRGELGDAADIAGRDEVGARSVRYWRACGRAAVRRSPAAAGCRCRPSRSTDAPRGCRPARTRRLASSAFGSAMHLLAVLQRAGGVIGDPPRPVRRARSPSSADQLGDIAGKRRDPRRLLGIGRVVAQHEPVILDRRAAARGVDDDRVEPAGPALSAPTRRYWRGRRRAPASSWPR